MSSWFGRKAPAIIPTDMVVPLRHWDDNLLLKSLVVYCLARYDVPLDPEKLHSSLERLVSLEGWRKLGARLRKNANGQIEYHVPQAFTKERPGVSFSHVQHDMSIKAHPLASRLPEPSPSQPAVVGDPEEFISLARAEGSPVHFDDYLMEDRGQLGLHIVSFTDATLVTLYYSHTSFDLMGWGAIMTAWTHVLHGREHLVAKPFGGDPGSAGFDALSQLGTNATEQHIHATRRMTMSSLLSFGLRNAYNMTVRAKENRIVCVPGAFIDKLRAECLEELKAAAGPGEDTFVSEADVFSAWWARLIVTQLVAPTSIRTISIQYAASSRKALGLSTDLDKDPYISNLFTILYSLLPASDIINKPLSFLAREIRRSIIEQGTKEQIEAYFALQNRAPRRTAPLFGDAGLHMLTLSNWRKANLYGHDFSPAACSKDDSARGQYPSYLQSSHLPFDFPEAFCFMGQDNNNNWWLYGYRVAGMWAKVEQALSEIKW
ncbi:hypothetical protein F5Y16DRAFT_373972 [Xylariaceae sp. FL0255]|nr:hypothetical protein F5Y16DRAFT_373972 [Xylariaceae sp. FL0255]